MAQNRFPISSNYLPKRQPWLAAADGAMRSTWVQLLSAPQIILHERVVYIMMNMMQQVDDSEAIHFLKLYRKMSTLNPLALEWINGAIDGLDKGFEVGVEYANRLN